MSLRADMYRQKAAEAKNRAAEASNPHVKSAFKEVARGWLLLAELPRRAFFLRRTHDCAFGRNPRCCQKLPAPVQGCYDGFHRNRCRVCETERLSPWNQETSPNCGTCEFRMWNLLREGCPWQGFFMNCCCFPAWQRSP